MFEPILAAILRLNNQGGGMELKLVPPLEESQTNLAAIMEDIRDMCSLPPLSFFGLSIISDEEDLLAAHDSITKWADESYNQLSKGRYSEEYWLGLIIIEDLLRSYAEAYNQPNRDELIADMVDRFDGCRSMQNIIDVSTPFVKARLSSISNATYLKPSKDGGDSANAFIKALETIATSEDDVVANIKCYYETVSLNKWLLFRE